MVVPLAALAALTALAALATAAAAVPCNTTAYCETQAPGSACVGGACTNPYVAGCLGAADTFGAERRVCSSLDGASIGGPPFFFRSMLWLSFAY